MALEAKHGSIETFGLTTWKLHVHDNSGHGSWGLDTIDGEECGYGSDLHIWVKDYGPEGGFSGKYKNWTVGRGGSPVKGGFDTRYIAYAYAMREIAPVVAAQRLNVTREKYNRALHVSALVGKVT